MISHYYMEKISGENTKKENVASLDEFRKKKSRDSDIKILRLPPNATDEEIESAWKKWWKKEVSFD